MDIVVQVQLTYALDDLSSCVDFDVRLTVGGITSYQSGILELFWNEVELGHVVRVTKKVKRLAFGGPHFSIPP